jgi:hypothetical protein
MPSRQQTAGLAHSHTVSKCTQPTIAGLEPAAASSPRTREHHLAVLRSPSCVRCLTGAMSGDASGYLRTVPYTGDGAIALTTSTWEVRSHRPLFGPPRRDGLPRAASTFIESVTDALVLGSIEQPRIGCPCHTGWFEACLGHWAETSPLDALPGSKGSLPARETPGKGATGNRLDRDRHRPCAVVRW